ncbi:response regulator [candidate division KSB1 bacterium]|nr:response regulator [candidate division KSB1 bacterium]
MEKLRTLVVDDEVGMRLSIKRVLDKYQLTLPEVDDEVYFEVDVAETGEEALEKIEIDPPDILLLDYKLPGISGLEILDKLASRESEMIIIMITAYASIETAVIAVKRGAFDFLAKPFTPEELRKNIAKAAQKLILARQVRKLAREKHQVRFQFISVLGHELKSPLNSIQGYLEIMKKRVQGDEIVAYDTMLDRCFVRIQGMRKMIGDLIDLTQIESGQKRREFKVIDLNDVIRQVVETTLPDAREKNITLNLSTNGPILMNCDSGEIEIILNNLISNAIKYNKPDGKVEIQIGKDGERIRISVADTGIGLTEEEAGRLFKEFVRIKNEKTRNILGSGLGLTIVKRIAMLYNGNVTVKSQPDMGSTFTVMLDANVLG